MAVNHLDLLGRLETWQRHPGLAELKRDDRRLLVPSFTRLVRDARSVANLVEDRWPSGVDGGEAS